MLRSEVNKYFHTRVFWSLIGISVLLLVLYSFLLAGMNQVGLSNYSFLDYLVAATNFYINITFPLMVCLFAAYSLGTEYQWRTLLLPLLEGRSRVSVISSKIGLTALATAALYIVFQCAAILIAFWLFSSQEIILENRSITYVEAVGRSLFSGGWSAMIIFLFGQIALLLIILYRSQTTAVVGSFMTFIVFILLGNVHQNPFAPLLQVSSTMVQSANLSRVNYMNTLAAGVIQWLILFALIDGLLIYVFRTRDIVLD
ncbi:MAG: ABC transporter permease [Anaerolineae bacterium]|nr:ABC transporter permease [Anaerolineae bacterium]